MLENIIHNNEKLKISFSEVRQEIFGYFSSGKRAFILVYHIFGTRVKIYDFKVYRKREKLGTKVLTKFESWAKKSGYEEIFGELVNNRDYSPPEVLIEFYRKKGYAIKYEDYGMRYAIISKKF